MRSVTKVLFQWLRRQVTPQGDFRDVADLSSDLGQQVLAIYERSFPESERDPVENIAESLKNSDPQREVTRLRVLVDQGVVVGFSYFATYKAYYLGFLKFIAVRSDIRGKGYGALLLQDAIRQVQSDGRRATGWPYLGLVFEVERPESAENAEERTIRQRRIGFYERNGAVMLKGIDFVAPPVAEGQPSIPFHLMMLRAVPKYGMQRWLRPTAVKAVLIEGYGEDSDSEFVRRALAVRDEARRNRLR